MKQIISDREIVQVLESHFFDVYESILTHIETIKKQ